MIEQKAAAHMNVFEQIRQSREVLGLQEEATLDEIKKAYRKLAQIYHPDACKEGKKKACEEMFKKVTRAYGLLMDYCAGYRYSFAEKDIKRNAVDREYYEHLKRFYDGWWGDLGF